MGRNFLAIDRDVWHSERVLALSVWAKVILVELHYRYNGKNNGEIMLPQRELVRTLRCSYSTVARAFRELHAAGLIETTVSGSFDNKNGARKGIASKYRLPNVQ